MKIIVAFLSLFLLNFTPSLANDNLDQLLKERKILYKDFEYYQSQKSSFWGTQSKKDLRKAIDVLKKIILKDSEIIKQINISHTKRNVQAINRNQVSQEYASELEYENNKLKLLLNKVTFDYNLTKEANNDLQSSNEVINTVLFCLIIVLLILVFYIFRLRAAVRSGQEDYRERNINERSISSIQNEGTLATGN
jgi:hypothetical protein